MFDYNDYNVLSTFFRNSSAYSQTKKGSFAVHDNLSKWEIPQKAIQQYAYKL